MTTRSTAKRLLLALVVGSLLTTGCAVYHAPPPGAPKVLVCHKGKKTLEVAEAALDAHLRHGDTRGPCR